MSHDQTTEPTQWIKASRSAGDNACVEMRRTGKCVEVRDTKQREQGPVLGMTREGFSAWLALAKRGTLDILLMRVE